MRSCACARILLITSALLLALHTVTSISQVDAAASSSSGVASHSRIKEWYFLGPFTTGKTEIEGDSLAATPFQTHGASIQQPSLLNAGSGGGSGSIRQPSGPHNCSRNDILDRKSRCPNQYFSEYATGGLVGWSRFTAQPNHAGGVDVNIQFPSGGAPVDLNRLIQGLSKISVLEWQGWATARFQVHTPGRYALKLTPVHTFYIDAIDTHMYAGDIYRKEWSDAIVDLAVGWHTLKVHLRAKSSASFGCNIQLLKPTSNVPLQFIPSSVSSSSAVSSSSLLPYPVVLYAPDRASELMGDLVEGAFPFRNKMHFAVPLLNEGQYWVHVKRVVIVASNRKGGKNVVLPKMALSPSEEGLVTHRYRNYVAPGGATFVPVFVELDAESVVASTPQWWQGFRDKDSCISFSVQVVVEVVDTSVKEELQTNTVALHVKCREWDQSFVFTWLDADGSAAAAAAIRPHGPCDTVRGCSIVVSYSGVGVSAISQANAYKYMPKHSKQYVFGYQHMWLLSPDRAGAHNDEGSQHLTTLQAIAYLGEYSALSLPTYRYRANTSRLMYAGHSRGGHGALMLAAHAPDVCLAVSSAGGWSDREQYGDANILFDLDHNCDHFSPLTRAIMESSIVENDMHQFGAINMRGLPTMIRVGSEDNTVPPFHARRMSRLLSEHGAEVTYSELPRKEHWWWDSAEPNDGGVCHDPAMRQFLIGHDTSSLPAIPLSFTVASGSPSTYTSGKGGYAILQIQSRLLVAKLIVERKVVSESQRQQASAVGEVWQVRTINTRRFSLLVGERYRPSSVYELGVKLVIDGRSVFIGRGASSAASSGTVSATTFTLDQPVHFCSQSTSRWRICSDSALTYQSVLGERGPINYGPARQLFQDAGAPVSAAVDTALSFSERQGKPWMLVVGTQSGDPLENAHLMRLALYLSSGHLHGVHASAPIVRDIDVDYNSLGASRQNLLLLGGPLHNSISRRWLSETRTSVQFNEENASAFEIRMPHDSDDDDDASGDNEEEMCQFSDPRMGVMFLNPFLGLSPSATALAAATSGSGPTKTINNNLVLLLAGTDLVGLQDIIHFHFSVNTPLTRAPFTNMIPDYLISSAHYNWKGLGGLSAAGYWDRHWNYDQAQGFVQCSNATLRAAPTRQRQPRSTTPASTTQHDDEL